MVNVLKRHGLLGDLLLLVLAVFSGLLSPYYVFVLTSVVITALLCLSVGVTTERAGVISLCQLALAGIGAWIGNWVLIESPHAGVAGALMAAGISTALLAALISLPTLRVRGVQLAIVTLAFALAVNVFLTRVGFPGVDEGMFYERSGWLESDNHLLLLCIGLAILVSRVLIALEQRPFGAAWFGAKFSERAVAAMGRNVAWVKISSFIVGAFIAGLAGALLVLQLGVLSSRNFEPMGSLILFALAVLSRSRFLSGALLAAVLTWFIPQALTSIGLSQWKDIGDLLFALGALHALYSQSKGLMPAAASATSAHAAPDTIAPQPSSPIQNKLPATGTSIVLNELGVRYGATQALANVSLTIRAGVVTGLVGPNGAGKTTMVDAITGFASANGEVNLGKTTLSNSSAHARARRGLRRTFQIGRAIPELTVTQYLRLAANRHVNSQEMQQTLDWLQCPGSHTVIGTLDVGTRRLLEVAGALLSHPKALLLDEPAAGMSARESEHLGNIIRQIPSVFDCAVLLIEHDLPLIRHVCTDVVVLEFGRVIAHGPTAETLALPHVISAYIGSEDA